MLAPQMHAQPTDVLPPTLPIVVQVGFAGSRRLFATTDPGVQQSRVWEDLLLPQLIERLQTLPQRLGLGRQHLLCGVSQLAVGADTLFTRACQAMGLPQRLLLPQPGEAFLAAGAPGQPDFNVEDRERACQLMTSAHIAELRVASTADERGDRFEDTNAAIVRESDVVVCLLREGATGRPGGTHELMQRARAAGKPVFALEVLLQDGQPVLSPWIDGAEGHQTFQPPGMPAELQGMDFPAPTPGALPSAAAYIDAVRRFASEKTRRHSGGFRRAAVAIIVMHIAATVLATLAAKGGQLWWIAGLLSGELLLLGVGLSTHHRLHHGGATRHWALTRLLAETLRSLRSVADTAVNLDYARTLAFPDSFGPLLRTAAVLHGLQALRLPRSEWIAERDRYIGARLTGPSGQLNYFEQAARNAQRRLAWANAGFWVFSGTAFVVTTAKLAVLMGAASEAMAPAISAWGGLLAIVLPVAAVGFLSWAAASDLEARTKTYGDMHVFLSAQLERLRRANSPREFARCVRETEMTILGENLGWFSRRLFQGVA